MRQLCAPAALRAGGANPDSTMPAYHRAEELNRVSPAQRSRPLLNAQEIENVLAFLLSLREDSP